MSGSLSSHRRAALIALLLTLVVAVGVGSAIGAIPNPGDGRFYACFRKDTGAVRVINYPKVSGCPKGQKRIDWNRTGPQGVQGVQGAQGPAGPADWDAIPNKPAGFADGVDNEGVTGVKLTLVNSPPTMIGPGLFGFANAVCPAGSRVTGGGFVSSDASNFNVGQSNNSVTGLTGWTADGKNTGATSLTITAHAICMTVEPAGAFTIAKKGLLPASVKKAMKKRGR